MLCLPFLFISWLRVFFKKLDKQTSVQKSSHDSRFPNVPANLFRGDVRTWWRHKTGHYRPPSSFAVVFIDKFTHILNIKKSNTILPIFLKAPST